MLGIQASVTAGERGAVFSNGSSLTATYVGFGDSAGKIAGDAGLTYTAASDLLVINHNAVALPAPTTGTGLQVGAIDGTLGNVQVEGFASSPTFTGRRANTTNASASGLVANDVMLALSGAGYTSNGAYSTPVETIQVVATETWSSANQGSKVNIRTTTTGSTTVVTRIAISGGGVSIAPATSITDATASTTTATGCLILSGGCGVAGAITAGGTIQSSGRFNNAGSATTAAPTGAVSMWRSGGTIGAAGDMILQTDLAGNGSFIFRNGITTPATVFTVGTTSASFASGVPLTISDSTASTTTSTGALIVSGGIGAAGTVTSAAVSVTGNITAANIVGSTGTNTSAALTGKVGFWRSGGTIGAAGDMVLQTDLAGNGAFIFRGGITTPVTTATISGLGSIVPGGPAAGTTNTDGFVYMMSGAGTPTGVPTSFTGRIAFYYDTTANKIWAYNGSWRGILVA